MATPAGCQGHGEGMERSLVASAHCHIILYWSPSVGFLQRHGRSLPLLFLDQEALPAHRGPEDSLVAAFCGLSPQRQSMNCCSLTLLTEAPATHVCRAPALTWGGVLLPGSSVLGHGETLTAVWGLGPAAERQNDS